MSGLEGGGEVSESVEVSEAPAEETGGEASEATQEAAVDEANETGGFDDSETAETSDVGLDEEDSEEDPDGVREDTEAEETGFEEEASGPENGEDFAEEPVEDSDGTTADEDGVGFEDGEDLQEEYGEEPEEDADHSDEDPEEDGGEVPEKEESAGDAEAEPEETPEEEISEEMDEDIIADEEYEDTSEEDPGEEEDYSDEAVEDEETKEAVEEPEAVEEEEASEESVPEDMDEDTIVDEEYDDISEEDPGEEEDYSDESVEDDETTEGIEKPEAAEDEEPAEDTENAEPEEDDETAEDEEPAEDTEDSEEPEVPEDLDRKAEISEETRQSLESFEQSNWDNLSQAEKEKAVEDLRDRVAEDLELENKPEVAYYNNPDPGDYGGYAAGNNTIYINQFNMGDAGETADTIAHESRHCWQHERAEHPETAQDYQFKENFDNYVKPEENFELYLDQPVERDAREYADQVKGQIGTGDKPQETPSETKEAAQDGSRTEEETRAPPEAEESKTVTELPPDFEAKRDVREERTSECYRQYGEIVKDAYENSDSPVVSKTNGDAYKELTQDEKTQLADKGKELIHSIPKEERGDFRVPDVDKIKGVREDGRIEENWKDATDGGAPGSRHMETPAKGEIIDRIGAPNGNYFAAMKEDGTPLSLEERAIGDYVPDKDITKNESYHSYEIKQDFTRENFEQALKDRYGVTDDMPFERTPPEYQKQKEKLDQYYEDCASDKSKDSGHEGEKYADTAETADGVKTSKIDSMFTSKDGGGKQYITPFDAKTLEELKMIKER